jgi:hypothetical protein
VVIVDLLFQRSWSTPAGRIGRLGQLMLLLPLYPEMANT